MDIAWIRIDNGDTFEGTPEQFAESFFSNVTEKSVRDWCSSSGCKVEFFSEIPANGPIEVEVTQELLRAAIARMSELDKRWYHCWRHKLFLSDQGYSQHGAHWARCPKCDEACSSRNACGGDTGQMSRDDAIEVLLKHAKESLQCASTGT